MGKLLQSKEIIAVGGGKGGVGKSLLASNLGVYFAQNGRRVVLVDADLGGANLHTCLGISTPQRTLSDFLYHSKLNLQDVMLPTHQPGLMLISGAQDFLGVANPKYTQKIRLLRSLQAIDVDCIILDLGAGTNNNTLDFFLVADKGILVVLPEPTSIENAYRFIKSALYRRLKMLSTDTHIRTIIERAMDMKNDLGIRSPIDLVQYIKRTDPHTGNILENMIRKFHPRIVLNQVRSEADLRVGSSMQMACEKFFGIHSSFIGHLNNDDLVWKTVRSCKTFISTHRHSRTAQLIGNIAHNLIEDIYPPSYKNSIQANQSTGIV